MIRHDSSSPSCHSLRTIAAPCTEHPLCFVNYSRLQREYGTALASLPSETELLAYLTVLFLVAKEGGASIEEEEFIEAWSNFLGIDPHQTRQAIEASDDLQEGPDPVLTQIKHPGLQRALLRDALRIIRVDGKIDPPEQAIVLLLADRIGLATSRVLEVANAVEQESLLLGLFAELALQTQPIIPREQLLRRAIDRRWADVDVVLEAAPRIADTELAAAIGFLMRLAGPSRHLQGESTLLASLGVQDTRLSQLSHLAADRAADLRIAPAALLGEIRDPRLKLLVYRDSIRVLADHEGMPAPHTTMLDQIAEHLGLTADERQQLLDLVERERRVRDTLEPRSSN